MRNSLSFKSIKIQKALSLSIQNMSFQGWIYLAAMKLKGWSSGVNNNLSLRGYGHGPPSVRLLSIWCILHTKLESICENRKLNSDCLENWLKGQFNQKRNVGQNILPLMPFQTFKKLQSYNQVVSLYQYSYKHVISSFCPIQNLWQSINNDITNFATTIILLIHKIIL